MEARRATRLRNGGAAHSGSGRPSTAFARTRNLLRERAQHVNRIKGLLVGQGISDYDPLHKDRRKRLAEMITETGARCPRV